MIGFVCFFLTRNLLFRICDLRQLIDQTLKLRARMGVEVSMGDDHVRLWRYGVQQNGEKGLQRLSAGLVEHASPTEAGVLTAIAFRHGATVTHGYRKDKVEGLVQEQ